MKKVIALCTAAVLCLSLLTACGPKEPEEKHLAAFAQTVQENHEFAALEKADPADQEMGAIMLENNYPGLKDMDLEQLEVYLAMISFSGGELALAQAKSEDDAAKVKEIFQNRITTKSTDGPGNYPEEVEMWKKSAKVVDNGSYVMLVNHPDSEAIAGEFEALFK
jgi:ABC-type oligopeptide transport system substrate-binding subunit